MAAKKSSAKKTAKKKPAKKVSKKTAAAKKKKVVAKVEKGHVQKLITVAELAAIKGVTVQAIYGLTRPGKSLYPAFTKDRLIDRNHPVVEGWLHRGPGNPYLVAAKKPTPEAPAKDVAQSLGVDLQELVNTPFGEVLEKYGSIDRVFNLAKTRKELAFAEKAQVGVDEMRGLLIKRAFVRQHVIGAIDGMHRRLLSDLSATIANRVRIASKSGETPEHCRAIVHDLIADEIERSKEWVVARIEGREVRSQEELESEEDLE